MSERKSGGRLAGRAALITGASRGIGRAIALRYAEEGAELFLTATSRDKLEETKALAAAHGGKVALHLADVSELAAVEAMVDEAVKTMGRIDVLVNNAGIYKIARLVDYAPEDFDRIMKVNVYGAFHVMQLVLRHMEARKRGKVVNIASTAGKWMSLNQSAYNASKHALIGLTRCAAYEMAPFGVNVNALCPGFVETEILSEFEAQAAILGTTADKVRERYYERVPLRRFMQPEEVAHLAVYLGSAESDGMTGQSIALDGGMVVV